MVSSDDWDVGIRAWLSSRFRRRYLWRSLDDSRLSK